MTKIIAPITLSIVLLISGATRCEASDVYNGKIGQILISQSQALAYFTIVGSSRTPPPSCATNQNWTFHYTTGQGQGLLALILAAKSTGASINVSGTGSCIELDGYESVNYMTIN